jgi:hypothetical protein
MSVVTCLKNAKKTLYSMCLQHVGINNNWLLLMSRNTSRFSSPLRNNQKLDSKQFLGSNFKTRSSWFRRHHVWLLDMSWNPILSGNGFYFDYVFRKRMVEWLSSDYLFYGKPLKCHRFWRLTLKCHSWRFSFRMPPVSGVGSNHQKLLTTTHRTAPQPNNPQASKTTAIQALQTTAT